MRIGYCEHQHERGIAQPVNASSALGFVVAGAVIIYTKTTSGPCMHWTMPTTTGILLILLGIATAIRHSIAEHWTSRVDETIMFALLGWFIVSYLKVLLPSVPTKTFVIPYIMFLCIVIALLANASESYTYDHLPFTVFASISSIIIAYCVYQHPGKINYFMTAVVLFIVAITVWKLSDDDGILCVNPESWFQWHAVWHILTAIAFLYLWKHVTSQKCK